MAYRTTTRASSQAFKLLALVLLLLLPLLTACGSIMHGSSQAISIASTPTGATVTVDGMERGVTPVITELKRKDHHMSGRWGSPSIGAISSTSFTVISC